METQRSYNVRQQTYETIQKLLLSSIGSRMSPRWQRSGRGTDALQHLGANIRCIAPIGIADLCRCGKDGWGCHRIGRFHPEKRHPLFSLKGEYQFQMESSGVEMSWGQALYFNLIPWPELTRCFPLKQIFTRCCYNQLMSILLQRSRISTFLRG